MPLPTWADVLPIPGKIVLVSTGLGLILEASRQVLPVPSRWAINKILRYYGDLVNEPFAAAIVKTADDLDIDPFALTNLIFLESGLNPRAINSRSGASGLIQFMPATAAGLGTSVAAIRSMSAVQQMLWVQEYLRRAQARHGSLRKPKDLMLSVFYPAYIGKSAWRPFPANVRRANPGIVTSWDYEQLVKKKARMPMRAILL